MRRTVSCRWLWWHHAGLMRRGNNVMASTVRRGPKQIWLAFVWSLKGLRAAWLTEASFRLEVCIAIVVIPLGLWLGDGAVEKLLLAGTPLFVLTAELLNSAIEAVVDRVSPEISEMAARAKDMGSAATFLMMLLVLATWVLILGMRWLA